MTAPARLLLLTVVCLLAVVPAARAATTAAFDDPSNLVTLTNDGSGETFVITLDPQASPATYKVAAATGTIDIPASSNCTQSDGNKTLSCTATDVSKIRINGGAGNDSFTINGSTGYDYSTPALELHGDAGNDTFTAGTDSALKTSALEGGPDDDTFNGSDRYAETFYPEAGNDTYDAGTAPVPAGADPVTYQVFNHRDSYGAGYSIFRGMRIVDPVPITVSLDGLANDSDGLSGFDNVKEVEQISGSDAGDTFTAGAAPVILNGYGGDDTLTGGPEGDVLYGGQDTDVLHGGGGTDELYDGDYDPTYRLSSDTPNPAGNDTMDGGAGDDTLVFGAGKDDVVGGDGQDTAFYSRLVTQVFDTPPTEDIEIKWAPTSVSLDDQPNDGVTGSGEGDNVHSDVENVDTTATSYGAVDRRSARQRGQRIISSQRYASGGADTIVGSGAANEIRTGNGNDSVDAKTGADVVDLGAGDDQANAIDTTTDLIRCGTGADNVGADLPGTNPARADVLTDCETVSGTPLGLEGGVLPTLPEVPGLTLGGKSTIKAKTFLKKFTVAVGVTSDQATTASGELTTTQATIAKVGALSIGSGKLASGSGKRTLKLKVAKKFRKKLKRKLHTKKQRRKGIKLGAVITVTNASGQATTARRTIKIKG